MPHSSARTQTIRSVRLSDDEVTAILDRLDEADARSSGSEHRRAERYSYRQNGCVVKLCQSGAPDAATYLVSTRNLSSSGMAFLHGSYIHQQGRCVVQLISTHGAWEDVGGSILDCRHVEGLIHEVAVRFDREIDVGLYCPAAVQARVLLVDDDSFSVPLAQAHLESLNAIVEVVNSGKAAIELALKNIYDVILMDIEMPEMDGCETTQNLREKGYLGRIVAVTALTDPKDRERVLASGIDTYLAKPVTREQLTGVLQSLQKEPLFSTLSGDDSMIELIKGFVADLPATLRKIEELLASKNMASLESAVRALKGTAGGYGFDPITEAAGAVEAEVRGKADPARIKETVGELSQWCILARAPAQSSGAVDG